MANTQVQTQYFPLAGGLNLVAPALTIPPGQAIDSMNFEPNINGGYSRMAGIERNDGRTAPSDGHYWVTVVSITGSVAVGNTITGATSGATAYVMQVTSATELIVTAQVGTFVNETINVSGSPVGTISASSQDAALTPMQHATYKGLAATYYRALIQKVPGSGAVRGVKYYNGILYAFRDNAGATACLMYKATTSGWSAITFGREIQFSTAVGEIFEGDTVTGGTSGATGVVKRSLLRTGTWASAGVGTLVFDTVTGVFQSGEALKVGGVTKATSTTVDTAIALSPGGKFQITNNNFSGLASSYRMYGCDGVNFAFEFDGVRLVPIRTGITPDAPKYIAIWKNMMVFAVASSVVTSGIGAPYSYTALTGAAELALGDTCTGLLPQTGDSTKGAIAIFTASKTYILYGTSSSDFNLVLQSPDAGAQPYTAQNIGLAYYLDTKGIVQINSTQAFGNFEVATITRAVQPLIDLKRGMAVSSCIVRSKNQMRLFFSDGTGIVIYISQQPNEANNQQNLPAAVMPFDHGATRYMNVVDSVVDSTGVERLFAGGSDGYVYELDRGTSIDGSNIFGYVFLAFNSMKSPRARKHFKRTILQATCTGIAQVSVGYDMSYAGTETAGGYRATTTLIGAGGYWDVMHWDQFNWDSPVVQEYTVDTPGNGRNIGLVVYGDSAIDSPYTVSSAIINYTMNRLER